MGGINIDTADAYAAARARAVAINRNRNFIIFPDNNTPGIMSMQSRDDEDRDRQDLGSLWHKSPRENEAEANAVACGKSVICNQNINIVIR